MSVYVQRPCHLRIHSCLRHPDHASSGAPAGPARPVAVDQVISDLMGKDVAARFTMITENAADIGDLDV
jgi:hypothetical protein